MSGASTRPVLRIEFAGEEYSASPGTRFTFGRRGHLVIDDNRFLHRVLGEFFFDSGLWWLANVGSAIAISINDGGSPSLARLAPGSSMPIAFEASRLRFEAGGTSYELNVEVGGRFASPEPSRADSSPASTEDDLAQRTTDTTSLPLTDDQFELLKALAAPLLHGEDTLPTNRQLASGLGWTVTKWNRKLDGLCAKYTKAGVGGLHGSSDRLANDRRTRLAEHVVHAGIVRSEHLDGG
jgi:hypothetical protein